MNRRSWVVVQRFGVATFVAGLRLEDVVPDAAAGLSLEVRRGEIFGVAGLVGAGRRVHAGSARCGPIPGRPDAATGRALRPALHPRCHPRRRLSPPRTTSTTAVPDSHQTCGNRPHPVWKTRRWSPRRTALIVTAPSEASAELKTCPCTQPERSWPDRNCLEFEPPYRLSCNANENNAERWL